MKAFDIVGYTYKAANYCAECVENVLTVEGGEYDGWKLGKGIYMPTEESLNEIAYHFGIDRNDEYSFDSGDFPKVIFQSMVEDSEQCAQCENEF